MGDPPSWFTVILQVALGHRRREIELTKWLAKAGEIIGIGVLDHIIVCDRNYLNLKAKPKFLVRNR
jgi:hypothetical protein